MTSYPKTLLVRPPELREATFAQFYTVHECLGLGYLAAYLRLHGFPVEIFDVQVEELRVEQTIEVISSKDFDILGLSIASSLALPQSLELMKAIKALRPDIHVTVGGYFPTFSYESMLKKYSFIDTVVRYEGEETLLELVQKIDHPEDWFHIKGIGFRSGEIIKTTPLRPLHRNLDDLPFPSRDTLSRVLEKGGMAQILGSRGCPGQCSFCSVYCFFKEPEGNRWRERSLESIAREIETLRNKYGCDEVWFVDDNFLGKGASGRKRIHRLFALIEKKGTAFNRIDFSCRSDSIAEEPSLIPYLVERGVKTVYLGVESAVQRILDIYQKGTKVAQNKEAVRILKENGVILKLEFIFFNPWITYSEVQETLAFLEETKLYDPYVLTSHLTIMRFTPLGQAVDTGEIPVVTSSPIPSHFDIDTFVPYEITDERVSVLFKLVSNVLSQFEPAIHSIYEIHNLLRQKRKILPESSMREYEEIMKDDLQLINEISLDLFKEAFYRIKEVGDLAGNIHIDLEKKLLQQVLQFVEFFAGVIEGQKQEFLKEMEKSTCET